jgi:hypothetical protein
MQVEQEKRNEPEHAHDAVSGKGAYTQAGAIFSVIAVFLCFTTLGYYLGWQKAWNDYAARPKIGAEPIKIRVVRLSTDVNSGQAIEYSMLNEEYETLPQVSFDAYNFAADCYGVKAKWALKKGAILCRHDILPAVRQEERLSGK